MQRTDKIAGHKIYWRLEEDKRLKRIHLKLHPQEGVIVRAPVGTKATQALALLRSNSQWLLSNIQDLNRNHPPREYNNGETIPFLGEDIELEVSWWESNKAEGKWDTPGVISVSLPKTLMESPQRRDYVRQILSDLYRQRAKDWFPKRVKYLNQKFFGHTIQRVTIKGQSKTLGSCSNLGNLNFNWRLLLAPMAVVDYVIIHELSHVEQMNHSPAFWKVVETACPEYKQYRKWLRDNSAALHI